MNKANKAIVVLWAVGLIGWNAETLAQAAVESALYELDFEQLMDMEVSTATRKEKALAQTPAAVYVVSSEDIRRSGATSIPEALRMVPGVNVAGIGPNKWSVSIRGFGSRYASKLLVLIDGRSVYTSTFSGVYWEFETVPMEEIERIEVIRGPGATLWGANAVNGIINIITRHSSMTHGGLADLRVGDQQQSGGYRWGASLGDVGDYRVFVNAERHHGFNAAFGEDTTSAYDHGQAGFRADWKTDSAEQWTLQGDVQRLRQEDSSGVVDFSSIGLVSQRDEKNRVAKANLLARWEKSVRVDSVLRFQGYLDHYDRVQTVGGSSERVTTLDLDFQHHYSGLRDHDIVWGLSYRHIDSHLTSTPEVRADPENRRLKLFGFFVQDEYELLDNRVWLTVGGKFEHNDYTGWEVQPNVRALWVPDADQTVWASVSRAVRTPSRAERDFSASIGARPSAPPLLPLPMVLNTVANPDYGSERLLAFELGYRARLAPGLSVDVAAFYNDYDDLLIAGPGRPVLADDFSHLSVPLLLVNDMEGETYGVEAFLTWYPAGNWRVIPALGLMRSQLRIKPGSGVAESAAQGDEEEDPQLQLSLRVGWSPVASMDLDLWLRHVSEIVKNDVPVDAYTELDLRAAWRPAPGLELALVGKNLLDGAHLEYVDSFFPIPLEVPRSVMATLRYDFQ